MWVIFVILEASIILGGIGIAVIVNRVADRVFVHGTMKGLDDEYRRLTAASRHDV